MSRTSALIAWTAFAPLLGAAEIWPQFRGPDGQGHAEEADLPLHWSESRNVAWRTPIPGRGWSSPVIDGDEIWMTTGIESELSEEEKASRVAESTNSQPLAVSGPLSLRAVCVSRRSGKVLHDVELMRADEPDVIHTLNSYASPTPVLADGRLYCHFGTNGTACLDTREARVLWTQTGLRLQHENGAGSSPVLWGDRLIFHCDGSDVQFIVGLDARTGKVAWKTDRSGAMHENPQYKKAYGTPLLVDAGGFRQLISPAPDWLYAYEPSSGKELWKLSYGTLGFSIVPRPVVGHGLVYMCTSFMRSELLAVRYPKKRGQEAEIVWRYDRQVPQMPSPLLVGEQIYFVSDKGGIVTSLDARTGNVIWQERLGGNFAASPLHAAGRIYFSSREGVTTVIRPGKTFEKLAENHLDGAHMASAAAVGGALYLRTDKALYRIEEGGGER